MAGASADAILFICSAFGPYVEAVAREHKSIPVLKPNQATMGASQSAVR
jgi:hypothetical protein